MKGNTLGRVLMMGKQNKIVYKITETEVIVVRILNTRTTLQVNFKFLRLVPSETQLERNRYCYP